jgi:hypothetical protein
MKKIAIILACLFASTAVSFAACDHAEDRASDGSRCGGRAADQRSGGR